MFPAGTPKHLLGCWVEVHGSFVDVGVDNGNDHRNFESDARLNTSQIQHPIKFGRGRRSAVAERRFRCYEKCNSTEDECTDGKFSVAHKENGSSSKNTDIPHQCLMPSSDQNYIGTKDSCNSNNSCTSSTDEGNESSSASIIGNEHVLLPRLNALEWYLKVYPMLHSSESYFPEKYMPVEFLQLPGLMLFIYFF